jgi:hypothetical protein
VGFYGFDYGKSKYILWVWIMAVTLAQSALKKCFLSTISTVINNQHLHYLHSNTALPLILLA